MKKYLVLILLFMLILSGCSDKTIVPAAGDFSFDLPDGYSVTNTTDKNCSIVRDEDEVVVGGIEVTALKCKDVNGSKDENVMLYLQNDFHMTNDIEYIASHWGKTHKIVEVNLKKHTDDGQEKMFLHYFFEKDSGMYHCWIDTDIVDSEAANQFRAITGVD